MSDHSTVAANDCQDTVWESVGVSSYRIKMSSGTMPSSRTNPSLVMASPSRVAVRMSRPVAGRPVSPGMEVVAQHNGGFADQRVAVSVGPEC